MLNWRIWYGYILKVILGNSSNSVNICVARFRSFTSLIELVGRKTYTQQQ